MITFFELLPLSCSGKIAGLADGGDLITTFLLDGRYGLGKIGGKPSSGAKPRLLMCALAR
jgi:hypothetical protein